MVANLETRGDDASLFSRRMIPWHNLGTVVQDEHTSTEEVLRMANLSDWDLQFGPFSTLLPKNCDTHLNLRAVIRKNPFYDTHEDEKEFNVLGVVGKRYEIVTNEELAEFAEQLLVGGRWETAGSLKYGTLVFMAMALDAEITVDEKGVNEKINSYLVVANGHDGEFPLTAMTTNIRPVCQNTLNWGLKNAQQKITIRHTRSLQGKMQEAARVMKLSRFYNETFQDTANELFQQSVTDDQFMDIVKAYYKEPTAGDSKTTFTRWNNKVDDLHAIWESDTIEGIKNTKWGALNTIEEYIQWGRNVYAGDEEKFWSSASGFEHDGRLEKTKLFETVYNYELV